MDPSVESLMATKYVSSRGIRRVPHRGARLAVISVFCLAWLVSPAIAIIPDWEPPEPAPEAWDWIKMTSGEWLKGEVHDLNDDKLAFESDELDDLDLDWDDVAELAIAQDTDVHVRQGGHLHRHRGHEGRDHRHPLRRPGPRSTPVGHPHHHRRASELSGTTGPSRSGPA